MRTTNILFSVLISLVFLSSFYSDDSKCLKIKGKLYFQDEELDSLHVMLYDHDKVVNEFFTKKKKMFELQLGRNSHYSLVISRRTFNNTLIIIDTEIPKNKECGYSFAFECDMIHGSDTTLNREFFDHPAAVIMYKKGADEFQISKKYNEEIKKNLGK